MTTTLQPLALDAAAPSLLTTTTLATIGGLATAVLTIVDSVYSATGWTSAWFGLVLAVALTLVAEFAIVPSTSSRTRVARAALAVVNGCLVFTIALGGNQLGNRAAGARPAAPLSPIGPSSSKTSASDRPFFHDWIR